MASEPSDSICQRRASSETAILPRIFSCDGRSTLWNTDSTNDFSVDVWKVATMGPSAIASASMPRLGAFGSWTWRTSNSPFRIHFRNRPNALGPKESRETEPLYGIATALPDETAKSGSTVSFDDG